MPSVVMNIRYVGMSKINAVSDHEKNRTPDGSSAIDPARTPANKILHGPATQADALKQLWDAGVIQPAAQSETPYVQMVLSASPEYFRDPSHGAGEWNRTKMRDWMKATRDWLRKEYGEDCVHISAHLDEDTPHIHALVVPTYDKKPRRPGRRKRGETEAQFQARKQEAEHAPPVRAVGRSSNDTWRKAYARRDARRSYAKAVAGLGIDYGTDFLGAGDASPKHKATGTWVKERAAELAKQAEHLTAREQALKEGEAQLAMDREEVRGYRQRFIALIDQAETFLRRPDLPDLARKAGAALMKIAGRSVPEAESVTDHGGDGKPNLDRIRRLSGVSAPPEKAGEEPVPPVVESDRPSF